MKSESATKSTMTGIPSSCRNLYHMEASPAPAATLTIEVTINVGRSTIHSPEMHWLQYGCVLCSVKYFATLKDASYHASRGLNRLSFPVLDRPARRLPRPPSTRHRRDVRVPHLLQIVRRQRRTETAATVENQLGSLVGNALLDVALDHALPHMLGAARVSRRPLIVLAHIDERRFPALELAPRFIDAHLANARFGIVDDLEEAGRMLHRPAGARLPVMCVRPRWALRRATS